MSELSPDATALVRAGREAFRPDRGDRDRVFAALEGVIGERGAGDAGGGHGGGGQAGATRLTFHGLRGWIVGGLAVAALSAAGVGIGTHLRGRGQARGEPALSAVAAPDVAEGPAAVASAAPAPAASDDAPPAESPHARSQSSSRAGARNAARPVSDSLAEEVRLLSRAEEQLNGGEPADALKTLAEHERRFPSGALAEERMVAQVQALCAIGRAGDARAELAKLTRAYPRSPHLERARAACGTGL